MIRPATEADIPAMLAIYGPYVENTTHSFEYTVPTAGEFLTRFRDHVAQFPWLVWEEAGCVAGYAYAGAPWSRAGFSWSAEVSVYLDPRIHGRGIGRALYARLEQLLALQGYRMAYAVVTSENTPSIAFHRAVGYRICGEFPGCGYKHGAWLGVTYLEKQLRELDDPGAFPAKWTNFI